MDNVVQTQTVKTEIKCTVQGMDVTISYEKPLGKNPGIPKAISANAVVKNPDSTEANPLPPLGGAGVNFALSSYVNGNVKKEDVAALIAELELELLKIVNA